jgi:hypothetical protein
MTAVVLASILLTIPFLVAFTAIPLWLTFKRPDTVTDHTAAHRYLSARAGQAQTTKTRAAHAKAA